MILGRRLADDGDGAGGQRLRREAQPVGLGAGDGEEQIARRDRAAVGGHARHVERRRAPGRFGQDRVEAHQCSPAPGWAGVLAKP